MYQIYFILEWHCTYFGQSFRPSSAVQDCTYSNRHMSYRYCCLLASKHTAVSVWLLYVQSATSIQQYLFGCCMYSLQQAHNSICLVAVCSLLASIQQCLFGCCMYSLQQAYSSICLVAVCTVCNKHTAVSVWLLYVQSWTADDGRKDSPKIVECHSKIK